MGVKPIVVIEYFEARIGLILVPINPDAPVNNNFMIL
jgi:hypothetical protein